MIDVMPDGKVILPVQEELQDLCGMFGDDAQMACGQASMTEIIIGNRLCG